MYTIYRADQAPLRRFFMKKTLILLLFAASIQGKIFAAQTSGSTSANFIKIPVSPIASGLNEAYTAMVGPDSIMYNPAASGLLNYSCISAAHNAYLAGISQQYAALNLYTYHFNIGAFFNMLSSGEIKTYDINDNATGSTSSSHKYYGVSLSKSWPRYKQDKGKADPMLIADSWTKIPKVKDYRPMVYRFSVGASAKMVSEKLDQEKASSALFDAGALLVLPNHWHLGASFQNMGGKQKFVSQTDEIPSVQRYGIAKDFVSKKEILVITFLLDSVKYSDYKNFMIFGMQTDILKMFQLRLGYRGQKDVGGKVSFGMGMNFDRLSSKESFFKGMRMDYALLDYGDLGATHRIGVQLIW